MAGGVRLLDAVNASAAALGLAPGLRVTDARARVPGLRLVAADPQADADILARLADWADRYTPLIGLDERDGQFLDIDGCAHLFGDEAALLDDLGRRLDGFGLAHRAAVADTPGAAWAIARHGDIKVAPPNGARGALAPLPVAALRLDPDTADTLQRLGLRTIGDLYPLPRPALAKRFGAGLLRRLDQALGTVGEPIAPRRPAPPWRVRLTFAEPIFAADGAAAALDRLLADLYRSLEAAALGARRLELALFRVDGRTDRLCVGLSRPSRDAKQAVRLFADALNDRAPDPRHVESGIETMILAAPVTAHLALRQADLDPAFRDWSAAAVSELAPLVDRLTNRLGRDAVAALASVESHIPERAAAPCPVFATARRAEAGWRRDPPRPAVLFDRPEPVEVIASLPEGPPALIRWRRRTLRIRYAAGPERIAPEWWRETAPTRDYYRAETADGRRLWLYRAGLYRPDTPPRWYLHGLFA